MSKAKEKIQLCKDGLMELYDSEEEPHIRGKLLGLHQLADEALAALEPETCSKCLRYDTCDFDERTVMRCKHYVPKEPCQTCGGSGQIGDEEFYLGRSVGWKACPDCQPKPEQSGFVARFRSLIKSSEDHLSDNKIGRLQTLGREAADHIEQLEAEKKHRIIELDLSINSCACYEDENKQLTDHIAELEAEKRQPKPESGEFVFVKEIREKTLQLQLYDSADSRSPDITYTEVFKLCDCAAELLASLEQVRKTRDGFQAIMIKQAKRIEELKVGGYIRHQDDCYMGEYNSLLTGKGCTCGLSQQIKQIAKLQKGE